MTRALKHNGCQATRDATKGVSGTDGESALRKLAATKKVVKRKPAATPTNVCEFDGALDETVADAQIPMANSTGKSADAKEADNGARLRAQTARPWGINSFFDNINAAPCGIYDQDDM